VEAVVELAGCDGYVVFGGPTGSVGAFRASLEKELHARTAEIPGLGVDSSRAEVEGALRGAATDLTSRRQEGLLEDLIQEAGGGGHAALGVKAAAAHLECGAADTLLLSRDFLATKARTAERLVRLAFHSGAGIEEVGGDPGDRLDREAGGVGVRLRFGVSA
jgi:hypothetical protein